MATISARTFELVEVYKNLHTLKHRTSGRLLLLVINQRFPPLAYRIDEDASGKGPYLPMRIVWAAFEAAGRPRRPS